MCRQRASPPLDTLHLDTATSDAKFVCDTRCDRVGDHPFNKELVINRAGRLVLNRFVIQS